MINSFDSRMSGCCSADLAVRETEGSQVPLGPSLPISRENPVKDKEIVSAKGPAKAAAMLATTMWSIFYSETIDTIGELSEGGSTTTHLGDGHYALNDLCIEFRQPSFRPTHFIAAADFSPAAPGGLHARELGLPRRVGPTTVLPM